MMPHVHNAPGPEVLTPAQLRVASLVASGMSPQTIATIHRNSVNTIRVHLYGAYDRLGIRSRAQLALWGVQNGLVRIEERVR